MNSGKARNLITYYRGSFTDVLGLFNGTSKRNFPFREYSEKEKLLAQHFHDFCLNFQETLSLKSYIFILI
jgi:hypothetical protein